MSRAKKAFAHQVGIERRRGSSGERILASCWLSPVTFDRPCLSLAQSLTRYLRFFILQLSQRIPTYVTIWRRTPTSPLWIQTTSKCPMASLVLVLVSARKKKTTTILVTVRYQSNAFREARRRGEAVEKVASTVHGNTKTGMAYMLDYWRANHHVASQLRPCQFKRTCTAPLPPIHALRN